MTSDGPGQPHRGTVFGAVADAYERGRPGYPPAAVAWLLATAPADRTLDVLELGAGTGKLTRDLVAAGHRVLATDADPRMLAVLDQQVPGARTEPGTAEDIPAPDAAYDVVVAAQAIAWFDLEQALPEIARVLRPGGVLGVVTHHRDERIPWVRRLGQVLGHPEKSPAVAEAVVADGWFGEVETETFKHRQRLDRQSVQDLVLSRSYVAALDESGRAEAMTDALALYDEYGRGMDGMYLPYFTECVRATVLRRPDPVVRDDLHGFDPLNDTMPRGLRGRHAAEPDVVEDDDMMMLIDFH